MTPNTPAPADTALGPTQEAMQRRILTVLVIAQIRRNHWRWRRPLDRSAPRRRGHQQSSVGWARPNCEHLRCSPLRPTPRIPRCPPWMPHRPHHRVVCRRRRCRPARRCRPVVLRALALLLAAIYPQGITTIIVVLILLGVGWSFTNVAGSALFNEALTTPAKASAPWCRRRPRESLRRHSRVFLRPIFGPDQLLRPCWRWTPPTHSTNSRTDTRNPVDPDPGFPGAIGPV